MSSNRRRNPLPENTGKFRQNHGRPGVVYVLENPGLREGWWKIGCSTRSGAHRARDLNFQANTGTPGVFRCVFECRTINCGLAEEQVFAELAAERRGKRGQEYFEIEFEYAKETIRRVCERVDQESIPESPQISQVQPKTLAQPQSSSGFVAVQPVQPVQPASEPVLRDPNTVVRPTWEHARHPERFCGFCRTLVIPKRRLLFLKVCPRCGNSM